MQNSAENRKRKSIISASHPGPLKTVLNHVNNALEMLPPDEKHWLGGGNRSSAIAIQYLKKNDVIAIPTDTIFGFAALAQSKEAIDKLYEIKGRSKTKPLAICISNVTEIVEWGEIDHIPFRLLTALLPGPVTIVLKRKGKLNPALNPGHENVGIRVPRSKFIRYVCKMIQQPLALTSANLSNEPSSLHPDEFKALWPQLGAIFYDIPRSEMLRDSQRVGSTVVDLTKPGEFKILRSGVRIERDLEILRQFSRERIESNKEENSLAACGNQSA